MSTWLTENWSHILAAVTAISGFVAGLWRLRLGGWMRNRLTVELDLIECQRRNLHREAYLAELLAEIDYYKHSRGGSAPNPTPTTQKPTKSRTPS